MISSYLSWWVAVSLLLGIGIYVRQGTAVQTAESWVVLQAPPEEIGSWRCNAVTPQEAQYRDPNVDTAWAGACRRSGGDLIEVYVGYAREQKGVKRILSPRVNYPDGDPRWNYVSSHPVEIPSEGGDLPPLRVNQVLLRHAAGQRVAILYWYQMAGQSFSDEYRYHLTLVMKKLRRQRTDAAVVRISVPIREDPMDAVFLEEKHLARALYPQVVKYFP